MKNRDNILKPDQARLAYRRAVQRSLEVLFEKSETESIVLTNRWWSALRNDPLFKTGLFMHDEPLNTAAELAGAERTPRIRDVKIVYQRIIEESMPKVRKRTSQQNKEKHAVASAA